MSSNAQQVEVVSRFDAEKDCAGLLYAPLQESLRFRKTRCYHFEYSGDAAALKEFIRKTLVDEVSQEVHMDGAPALDSFRFYLDYGLKPGVLDLEKDSILNYYRELEDPGFTITALELTTRIYIFGETGEKTPDVFVRDIVNPAIHRWSLRAS